MSAAIRCELCGVVFAPFGDALDVVEAFANHPCKSAQVRRNHPSQYRTPGGAA